MRARIQYAAASWLHHLISLEYWIAFAGDDGREQARTLKRHCNDAVEVLIHFQTANTRLHRRGAVRPSFASMAALERKEGAGKTGCALHPRSRVQ